MWCVPELDEEYIRRMEDILAVYEKALNGQEPVVCVDEKPVVLHQEVRPPHPMQPGRIARRDGEYRRGSTANVFCGVQPKAGRYFPKVTAKFFTNEVMRGLLANSLETATLTAEGFQDVGKGPGSRQGEFVEWLTIRDQEQSVRDDVERIRKHPLVPENIAIYGYVYDVKSGRLLEVPAAKRPAEAVAA